MIVKEISYSSEQYDATKYFREKILRLPLGLILSEKDIEGEEEQIHIAAIEDDGTIIGTVLLKPLSTSHVKLRQMAVDDTFQGNGTGRKLVLFAESLARNKGFEIMEMHARIYAQGFYEKLGYQTVGAEFIEATVPTIKMTKALQ